MIGIESYERTILSLAANDRLGALKNIEKEIAAAKAKGHQNVVKRLRNLLRAVAGEADEGYRQSSLNTSKQTVLHSTTELYVVEMYDVSLASVIISHENERAVQAFINEWKNKDKLSKHSLYPTNRLLLYGAPGTGKTKLAHAIATELNYPVVNVFLDELISSYLGKTGKNIREIFNTAAASNVVIFLDEIDTIAKKRNDNQDTGELKRVVTVFLQNIDMLAPNSIVIGATNHEDLLDKAIWRRFPVRINMNLPDSSARKKLFQLYLAELAKDIDTDMLAAVSEGLSGSAIEEICKDLTKKSILNIEPASTTLALRLLFMTKPRFTTKTSKVHWKKEDYAAAQLLKNGGYTLRDIERLSGMPYTTLREHIK